MYTVEIYEGNNLVEKLELRDKKDVAEIIDYYRMMFDTVYKYRLRNETQYVFANCLDTTELAVVVREED